jgi:hypothetical protein
MLPAEYLGLRAGETIMRSVWLATAVVAIAFGASPVIAGSRVIQIDPADQTSQPETEADFQKYRGFMYDLSEYAGRKDLAALEDNLKHQLDMVADAGFSPKALAFFHSIPIMATETDCLEVGAGLACYGPVAPRRRNHKTFGLTVWDHDKQQWSNPDFVNLAADSGRGVIMVRQSMMQHADDPILLHEFLHAFNGQLMSLGFDNLGIKGYFSEAKSKNVFGNKKSYTLFNAAEFFAITASIFLAGKESMHEPKTRAVLKEKMPEYYKYLVTVFGFDPDPSLPTPPEKDKDEKDKASVPVASAN